MILISLYAVYYAISANCYIGPLHGTQSFHAQLEAKNGPQTKLEGTFYENIIAHYVEGSIQELSLVLPLTVYDINFPQEKFAFRRYFQLSSQKLRSFSVPVPQFLTPIPGSWCPDPDKDLRRKLAKLKSFLHTKLQ